MSGKKPSILLLLALPFYLAKFLLDFVGVLTFFPIYAYIYAASKFLFSSSFDKNQAFYVLFSLPRMIITITCFLTVGVELFIVFLVFDTSIPIKPEGAFIATMASVMVLLLVSYLLGYKVIHKRFKFPKLEKFTKFLELIVFGILDIVAGLFTVLIVLMVFRAKYLFRFKFEGDKRKFLAFSLHLLQLSILDVLCIFFWAILILLPWRFKYTLRNFKKTESHYERNFLVISQAFQTIFDLIFIPQLTLVILSPFGKAKRLISNMNELSVIAWRRLIFDEFISALLDVLPFICFLFSLMSLYQIPLCIKLYKKTWSLIKAFSFEKDVESLRKTDLPEHQKRLGIEIYEENKEADSKYRSRYFFLASLVLLDLLILTCHFIMLVSVYRYIIFLKTIKTLRSKNSNDTNLTLNDKEYRNALWKIISMEADITYPTYPKIVIKETLYMLLDIPTIALCTPLLCAPWRLIQVLKFAKIKWSEFEDPNPKIKIGLRQLAIFISFLAIVDWLCMSLFLVSLVAFWRWNYVFPKLRKIQNNNRINQATYGPVACKFDAFDVFAFKLFGKILVDFCFSPILLLLAPFYLLCFWRFPLLIKCLKTYKPSQFFKHQEVIFNVGIICINDFRSFPALFLTYITIYKIPDLDALILLRRREKLQASIPPPVKNQEGDDIEKQTLNQDVVVLKQQNPALTASEIMEKEREILQLSMSRKCAILILLDFFSLPFFVLTFTHPASIKFYSSKTKDFSQKIKDCKTAKKYYKLHRKKAFNKFKAGFFAITSYLATLGILILLCFLLWRIPTFVIILADKEMREYLLKDIIPQEARREVITQSRSKTLGVIVLYCLKHLLKDLLVSPFFFILFTITPWRAWLVLKQFYRYNTTALISSQIKTQRKLIRKQVKRGLSDIHCALKLTLITVTLIRIPFLFMVILKNRFTPSATRHPKNTHAPSCPIEDKPTENSDPSKFSNIPSTRLSFKKCVKITFIELLKDLAVLPFGLLVICMAPWRIFSLYEIYISQIDRIPTFDNQKRRKGLPSRRRDIFSQIVSVFRVDYPGLLEMTLLVLSLYKIPAVFMIFVNFFRNLSNKDQFSFKKSLDIEFNKLLTALIKFLAIFVILLFALRIPKAFTRLQRYRNKTKAQKKALIKQKEIKERKPDDLTFNDIKWDTYGVMCQFLTVQDLARLSQVNKKFYSLNQKDFYWEYQYKRDFSDHKGQTENHTFKEKCVSAYVSQKAYVPQQPLTRDQRDDLYGVIYILSDEAIKSLKSIPHILLLPAKLLSLILSGLSRLFFCKKDFPYFAMRRPVDFVDRFRNNFASSSFIDFFGLESVDLKSFKNFHIQLPVFITSILVAYICEAAYVLGHLTWLVIRLLSAGGTYPFTIQYQPYFNLEFQRNNNDPPVTEYQNRALRYPLYILQLLFLLSNFVFWAGGLAILPFAVCYFSDFKWYEGIFGPCWLFLFHYAMMFNLIRTHIQYDKRGAPYFQPWKCLTEPFVLIGYLCKLSWEHFGKPLFDKISDAITFMTKLVTKGVKAICEGLNKVLKAVCKGLTEIFKAIYKACKFVLKNLILGYAAILTFFTKVSLKCGVVGDLLLIPFALAWMFWPMIIPVILKAYIYFIPCGIVGMIFMIYGYRVIRKASAEAQ